MADWAWMGMGWGWLFLLLFLAGVVVLVVLVIRLVGGGVDRGRPGGPDLEEGRRRARAILDERYARGEIDSAEYDERLRGLRDER